jgi:predicted ester cyclase
MSLDSIAYQPYKDPDDFIREVTDRIWIGRDISYIVDNYEPDAIVHGALGTINGRDEVINGSLMRIADTPTRVGQAEDVVWEARGDDAFLSSHLVFSADRVILAGRQVQLRSRTIANCLYRRGRMVEEWVVRDSLAGCLQTGEDPDAVARQLPYRGFTGSMAKPAQPDILTEGDSGPRPDDFRPECELVLQFIDEVWDQRRLNKVGDFMIRDLFLHSIGDQSYVRPDGYQRELLRMLAPFPTGLFEVRDLQANHSPRYAGLRIAVTWKFTGTYSGAADFGPLTGQPVDVLGISQFLIQDGRIVREIRVYDEVALRAQIHHTRGDEPIVNTNIY